MTTNHPKNKSKPAKSSKKRVPKRMQPLPKSSSIQKKRKIEKKKKSSKVWTAEVQQSTEAFLLFVPRAHVLFIMFFFADQASTIREFFYLDFITECIITNKAIKKLYCRRYLSMPWWENCQVTFSLLRFWCRNEKIFGALLVRPQITPKKSLVRTPISWCAHEKIFGARLFFLGAQIFFAHQRTNRTPAPFWDFADLFCSKLGLFPWFSEIWRLNLSRVLYGNNSKCAGKPSSWCIQRWVKRRNLTTWSRSHRVWNVWVAKK